MKLSIFAVALLSLGAACPPNGPSNPVTGQVLCDHLSAIGCAQPNGCSAAYDAVGNLTTINAPCLMAAGNRSDAAKCGVKCE